MSYSSGPELSTHSALGCEFSVNGSTSYSKTLLNRNTHKKQEAYWLADENIVSRESKEPCISPGIDDSLFTYSVSVATLLDA